MSTLTQQRFNRAFNRLFSRTNRKDDLPTALVACSGGVDSMALLDLCHELYQSRNQLSRLSVCYINHGQRPDTAEDERVISKYCRKNQLQLAIRQLDVSVGASEDLLREARYSALKNVAVDRVVLTAHHGQDNLETYFLRLIRGAHPDSLRGIPARARRQNGLRIARPLLTFSKSEITVYARAQNLDWHEDQTNLSPRYARNRIRNELLPLLEDLRPGSIRRITAFFESLKSQRPPRRSQVDKVQKQLLSNEGAPVLTADFHTLKAAVDAFLEKQSHRTTRWHWESLKQQLAARHLTRLGGGPPKELQFPGGHALCFKGNRLFWVKNS